MRRTYTTSGSSSGLRRLTLAGALLVLLAAAGCSSDDEASVKDETGDSLARTTTVESSDNSPPDTPLSSLEPGVAPITAADIGSELLPGRYQSTNFVMPLAFTLPAGWKVFEDEPGQFGLAVMDHDGPPLLVIRDVAAASTECLERPEPGVGTSAEAITTWLAEHEGLAASEPTPVSLGGLDGYMIDVALDPAWTGTCPFSGGAPTVATLGSGGDVSAGFFWGLVGTDEDRVYLLDVDDADGGGNVLVMLDICCGVSRETRETEASPVIDSFDFVEIG